MHRDPGGMECLMAAAPHCWHCLTVGSLAVAYSALIGFLSASKHSRVIAIYSVWNFSGVYISM